jgi:hypothetical protein
MLGPQREGHREECCERFYSMPLACGVDQIRVQVLERSMEWSGDDLIQNREMEGFGIDANAWYGWVPFLLSEGSKTMCSMVIAGLTMSSCW